MEHVSKSAEETIGLAKAFCQSLEGVSGPLIVELVGDLGAGKTTFMKGVGEFFEVSEEIVSPTFLIQRNYEIQKEGSFKRLIHIDAYRIEKIEELETIGWQNYSTDPANIIFIEWPANMRTDLVGAHRIEFAHIGENERKIIF